MLRLLAAVLCVAVLLPACDREPPAASASEPPPATASCAAAEIVPIQGQGHLVGDQEPPVAYNSVPPTSGWHTSTDVPTGVADEPLSEPEQVAVLEQGGVVISHNGLEEADVEELERLVTERHPAEVALTSYDRLDPGAVALTAWGAVQLCEAVDIAAIEAFITAYSQR